MSKQSIISRLQWLYPLEKFNGFLFSAALIYVIIKYGVLNNLFLIYGLFLMIIILFQGQHYWKLKLFTLINKSFNQQKNIGLFKFFKKLNVFLITVIPFVLFIQLYILNWNITAKNFFVLAIAANVFGILEHINYYHWQLMIDKPSDVNYIRRNKKLKIASLNKDLKEKKI